MEPSTFFSEFFANCKSFLPAWLALIAVMGFALRVFGSGGLRTEYADRLGTVLSGSTPTAWVRATNQAFLGLFERLFKAKGTLIEQGIWAGLLLSPLILIGFRLNDSLNFSTDTGTANLLLFSMSLAFSIASGTVIGRIASAHNAIRLGRFLGIDIAIGIGIISGIGTVTGGVISIGIAIFSGISGSGVFLV